MTADHGRFSAPRLGALFTAGLSLLAVSLLSAPAHALTGSRSGPIRASGVIGREFTLAPGASTVWETSGCTGNEDTVLLSAEGTLSMVGPRLRPVSNDDFVGLDGCSKITVTNNNATTTTYTLFLAGFFGSSGTVTLKRDGATIVASQAFNSGARYYTLDANQTTRFKIQPLRSAQGGGIVDSTLHLINASNLASPGGFSDDNEGLAALSSANLTVTSTQSYWVLNGMRSGGGPNVKVDLWVYDSGDADSDADGIPNTIETSLGTSTTSTDTDGDGLTDFNEVVGVPVGATTGGNDASLILPWMGGTGDTDYGSDPLVDDLFVEVDYMTATGHNHDPRLATNWNTFHTDLDWIFRQDANFTGRTIRPHVQISQSFTESTRVSFASCTGALDFYSRKSNAANFDPLRAAVYHYAIWGHQLKDTSCVDRGSSGQAEIWGNDLVITLGSFSGSVGTVNDQRGTFVHELGHNLSLVHNNNDSASAAARSCIHTSPMNYRYQMPGTGLPGQRAWSYSRGQCDAGGTAACANTCNASRCVPSTQTTPKDGCNPNSGSCDCDRAEWNTVNLDIPSDSLWTFTGCHISNCEGDEDAIAGAAAAERWNRAFFLGDHRENAKQQREVAGKRRQLLGQRGFVEGKDFTIESRTGRAFSID